MAAVFACATESRACSRLVLLTYFEGEFEIEFSGFVVTDGLLADFTRAGTPIGDLVHQNLGSGALGGGGVIEYQHLFINGDGVYIAGEMEAVELPVSYGSAVYVGPDKAQIDGEWTAEIETAAGARTPFSIFIPGGLSGGRVTLSAYDNDSYDSVETEITIP